MLPRVMFNIFQLLVDVVPIHIVVMYISSKYLFSIYSSIMSAVVLHIRYSVSNLLLAFIISCIQVQSVITVPYLYYYLMFYHHNLSFLPSSSIRIHVITTVIVVIMFPYLSFILLSFIFPLSFDVVTLH